MDMWLSVAFTGDVRNVISRACPNGWAIFAINDMKDRAAPMFLPSAVTFKDDTLHVHCSREDPIFRRAVKK